MKPNYPNLSAYYEDRIKELGLSDDFLFAIAVSLLEEDIEKIGRFWRNSYLINAINLTRLPDFKSVFDIFERLASVDEITLRDLNYLDKDFNSFSKSRPDLGHSKLRKFICKDFQNYSEKNISEENIFEGQSRIVSKIELQETTKQVKNDGYAVLKGFFNKKFVSQLANITALIEKTEKADGVAHLYDDCSNQRTYNLAAKDSAYSRILENRAINYILENLFSRNTLHLTYSLSSFAANTINPGSKIGYPHIDSMVPDPIPPWLMRCLITIPLVDTTVENGATLVVPGSHKCCSWPSGDFETKEVALTAEPGDVLIWDGLIWHRAGANRTTAPRTVLLITFAASFFREIAGEEDHPQVIPEKMASQFSPHVRNLMGFGRGVKEGSSHNLTIGSYKNHIQKEI